jgi:hypothetical protein
VPVVRLISARHYIPQEPCVSKCFSVAGISDSQILRASDEGHPPRGKIILDEFTPLYGGTE